MSSQIHNIELRFDNIFRSIFPYLITKECDGRTEGRAEKHGTFYNIEYKY